MALGLTQTLTQMSTRNISWGWRRPVRRADNLTTFMCRLSLKSGSVNFLEPSGPVQVCNGIALPFCTLDALISHIYSWNKTLHVSDSSPVHHQEFFTVHTAMVYVIQVCWQLASRIRMFHLHVSDSSSVHHQEFFTVYTAMVYVIQVCWQLASRILILLARIEGNGNRSLRRPKLSTKGSWAPGRKRRICPLSRN